MAATTQPITISQSRSHPSYAWTAQSPMSFEGGSASSISVHPAPIFIAGSFGSVGSVGGTGASFGSRFYPACSPGKIINPLDPNDFKCRISSSIDSEHGQFIKALNGDVSLKEDELCRNYTCCGQPLNDFHALVEHFEETHVVVFDHNGAHNSMNHPAVVAAMQHAANSLRSSESSLAGALGGGSGANVSMNVQMSPTSPTTKRSGHTRNSLSLSMTGGVAAFDPDDMELDVDSPASSASTSSSPESSDSSLPQRTSASATSSSTSTTMNANANVNSLSSISAHQSSSFSTPPDTPLLSTPISPLASSAGFGSTTNNSNSSLNGHHQGPPYIWGLDATHPHSQAIPTGPAAFETTAVHLPPKSPRGYGVHSSAGGIGIGGGMHSHLVHPYASTLQQHRKHSLYKLQSFSSAAAGAYSAHGSSAAGATAAALSSALNGYAGYSDYSSALPGTIRSGSSSSVLGASEGEKMRMGGESSIPPSLLFCESGSGPSGLSGRQQGSSSTSGVMGSGNGGVLSEENTPLTTPAQSRAPSPTSALVAGASSAAAAAAAAMASSSSDKEASGSGSGRRSSNTPQPTASTTLSRPGASLLLNKPFKCPKPGCMKSYKQANGLKYHLTHGQCNFNPPAELASVEGLSEREAERKLRPFCCQVPPCQRRYKNMNGLRYHYQHSGDHGAIGLALLQSGNHDATKSHPSPPSISLDTALAPATPSGSGSNTPVQVTTPLLAQMGGGVTGVTQGTFSAPGTPGGGMNGTSGMQFSQMQGQAGLVGGAYATQSQPASAYATPWGSRSGSPFGGAGGMGGGEQQQVQTMAQRFAGLASGQWVS